MPPKIVLVAGPTASGKTALAIALAKRLRGEVISADSMQIYRRMVIGTAAPSAEEMDGVPHHMIGIVEPNESFSCADYTARAEACIRAIHARGHLPIVCGGTGLYFDSLTRVASFSAAEGSEEIRTRLHAYAEAHGPQALYDRLMQIDPDAAEATHANNVRRVVRALEIYESTGVTKTEWDRRSTQAQPKYDACSIVLDFRDRSRLYDRIDRRVTGMLDAGLAAEVRALYEEGLLHERYVASQAIGYKEFLPYFAGDASIDACADQIRQSSRRYAKRQLTWFRRWTDALWLYPDEDGDALRTADALAEAVILHMQARGFLG